MPTKKTFAIVPITEELARRILYSAAKDTVVEYPVDERPDIRCDKCGAPVRDDGRFDAERICHDYRDYDSWC